MAVNASYYHSLNMEWPATRWRYCIESKNKVIHILRCAIVYGNKDTLSRKTSSLKLGQRRNVQPHNVTRPDGVSHFRIRFFASADRRSRYYLGQIGGRTKTSHPVNTTRAFLSFGNCTCQSHGSWNCFRCIGGIVWCTFCDIIVALYVFAILSQKIQTELSSNMGINNNFFQFDSRIHFFHVISMIIDTFIVFRILLNCFLFIFWILNNIVRKD